MAFFTFFSPPLSHRPFVDMIKKNKNFDIASNAFFFYFSYFGCICSRSRFQMLTSFKKNYGQMKLISVISLCISLKLSLILSCKSWRDFCGVDSKILKNLTWSESIYAKNIQKENDIKCGKSLLMQETVIFLWLTNWGIIFFWGVATAERIIQEYLSSCQFLRIAILQFWLVGFLIVNVSIWMQLVEFNIFD